MKIKSLLILILFLAAIGFVVYKIGFGGGRAVAGLKIASVPATSVYLDDKFIGKTPFDGRHPAGNYVLKLVADESGGTSWQDKIVLTPQTLTYVKKELGSSELTTAGEVVYLEKIGANEIELNVTSSPDAAVVSVDGMEKGITPLNVPISEGEHDVVVNSTGFVGRTVKIKAVKGFRVTVNSQLALSQDTSNIEISPTPGEQISGQPAVTGTQSGPDGIKKPYVVIKETPTNFLRVRLDASTSASEVAQLKPGTQVPFLEEKSGWYKITYEEGKDGWISSKYANKVE